MHLRRRAAGVLLAVLLSSCGGGGGGDDGGAAGGFSVSYDRSSVSFDYESGEGVAPATVEASTRGTPSGNVYVGTGTPNGQADPNIERVEILTHGSAATVQVYPNAALAAGTYTGTLLLMVCSDASCAHHYGGSPYALQYTIHVRAGISVSPSVLNFSGPSQVAQSATVALTLPPGVTTYTATAADPWAVVDQLAPSGFRLTVPARPAGNYGTSVLVKAGSFERTIQVVQTSIARHLELQARSLSINAVSGNAGSASIQVQQLAEGQSGVSAEVVDAPWLSVGQASADAVQLVAASMPSGTYQGEVLVRSGGEVVSVTVNYVVAAPAGGDRYLDLSEHQAAFAASEGELSATKTLTVTHPSWSPAISTQVVYQSGLGWLQVGTTAGGDLQLRASAVGLPKGQYFATLNVSGAYPVATHNVGVSFLVGEGLAQPAPQAVTLHSDSTAATLKGSIPVATNGVVSGTWSATSSASWLKLTAASGALGSPIAFTVDKDDPQTTVPYTDVEATVSINARASGTPDGAPGLTPVTATITLRRELAEVHYAGPGVAISGQAGSVIVRGRGFDHLANPAARLSVGGAALGAVSRLSATSLKVELPALAAGDYPISVSNAIGATTPTATLRVRDAQAYAGGVLASGGESSAVLQDPLHRQVFSANRTLSAVQRFRESGGTWTQDTLAFAGLSEIALSPDASTLVVSTVGGTLYLVDPLAFSITGSYAAGRPIKTSLNTGHGLSVTNDGKVWMAVGEFNWGDMVYFDLRTRTFGTPQFGTLMPAFDGGPWFEVSRNGERLVAVQTAGSSSLTPELYMDASLGVWKQNPIGLDFFYWSQSGLDETGSRFLHGGVTVYDAAFVTVGRVKLPSQYFLTSAVLSPDGRRVYAVAVGADWPNSSTTTRLYVLDSSVAPGTVAELPVLGHADLADDPTCNDMSYGVNCLHPMMNISADGKTLFLAGREKFIALPVPAVLSTAQSVRTREGRMTLWIRKPGR